MASGQGFRAPLCVGPGGAVGRERVVGDARSDWYTRIGYLQDGLFGWSVSLV